MKRFFCTICKKVKRVRRLPADVAFEYDTTVTNRTGTCRWHSDRERTYVQSKERRQV